jgi:predicted Rossmann fold nucleotide-binding protein DprA/Smf involved in DNA uptake
MDDLFSRADVAAPATPQPPAQTAPYANQSTSKAAAKAIEPHMGRMEQRVFDSIRARPKTAREVEEQLGMRAASVTARIRELVLAGRIEDSGEKRDTGSGRKAIVWRVRP